MGGSSTVRACFSLRIVPLTTIGLSNALRRQPASSPRGWLAVQLRDKERAQVSLRVFASRLRLVTRRLHAWLFINGDAKLARDVGADGVHLGRGSGTVQSARAVCRPETLVSVAVHSDDDVRRALEEGADAALVSPDISDSPRHVVRSSRGSQEGARRQPPATSSSNRRGSAWCLCLRGRNGGLRGRLLESRSRWRGCHSCAP